MLQSAAAAVKSAVHASVAAGGVGFDKILVRAVDLFATQPRDPGARYCWVHMAPATCFFLGDPRFVTFFGINLLAAVFGALGNQFVRSSVPLSGGSRLEGSIGPALHQAHHGTAAHPWDKSGTFALWEGMFGTLHTYRGEEITLGLAEDTPRADDRLAALPPTAPRYRARTGASGFRFGAAERKSIAAPQNRPERRGKGWMR